MSLPRALPLRRLCVAVVNSVRLPTRAYARLKPLADADFAKWSGPEWRPPAPSWANLVATPLYERAKKAYYEAPSRGRRDQVARGEAREAREAPATAHVRRPYLTDELRASLDPSAPLRSYRRSKLFSREDDARILTMLKEGASWSDVGKALGMDSDAIKLRFRSVLDPRRREGTFTREEDAAILAYAAAHDRIDWKELVWSFGYSRSRQALKARYESLKSGVDRAWSDEERKRLLEGVTAHKRDWVSVARHVGGSRTPAMCRRTFESVVSGRRVARAPYRREELERLMVLVEKHARRWKDIAVEMPNRTQASLRARYNDLLPAWMRTRLGLEDVRAVVRAIRGDGDVTVPFADPDVAAHWVALFLGMDVASQVDWDALNRASGAERGAAMDAVERELVPRLTAEEWKEGATCVWVPAWSWPRPLCTGRQFPIRAVAEHPAIRPFVRRVLPR